MRSHCFLLLLAATALGEAIDISKARSDDESERYVGQEVMFTGEVAPTKAASVTNGHVHIELRSTTTSESGKPVTLVGRLRKDVVQAGGAVDAQGRPVQAPYPRAHWWIEGEGR